MSVKSKTFPLYLGYDGEKFVTYFYRFKFSSPSNSCDIYKMNVKINSNKFDITWDHYHTYPDISYILDLYGYETSDKYILEEYGYKIPVRTVTFSIPLSNPTFLGFHYLNSCNYIGLKFAKKDSSNYKIKVVKSIKKDSSEFLIPLYYDPMSDIYKQEKTKYDLLTEEVYIVDHICYSNLHIDAYTTDINKYEILNFFPEKTLSIIKYDKKVFISTKSYIDMSYFILKYIRNLSPEFSSDDFIEVFNYDEFAYNIAFDKDKKNIYFLTKEDNKNLLLTKMNLETKEKEKIATLNFDKVQFDETNLEWMYNTGVYYDPISNTIFIYSFSDNAKCIKILGTKKISVPKLKDDSVMFDSIIFDINNI